MPSIFYLPDASDSALACAAFRSFEGLPPPTVTLFTI
ncbi:hypothetical protein KKC_05230 [Listeria fleischmannii subsp. coloradonensis]|nr:hypothetical protein KKC_05230 [Listeria fleischmannii subsp. coloradonensis]